MRQAEATLSHPLKRRVFFVDDHDVVRFGAAQLVSKQPDLESCGGASSVPEALPLIRELKPDVIVADISLKNSNGLELLKVVRTESPGTPILVMSMHDELVWAEVALRAGAKGYIMKENSIEHLVPALRALLNGKIYLSPAAAAHMIQTQVSPSAVRSPLERLSDRERQVLGMLGEWKNAREIAAELNLSTKTVEYYKQNIKEKLNLKSAAELTQFAVEIARGGGSTG